MEHWPVFETVRRKRLHGPNKSRCWALPLWRRVWPERIEITVKSYSGFYFFCRGDKFPMNCTVRVAPARAKAKPKRHYYQFAGRLRIMHELDVIEWLLIPCLLENDGSRRLAIIAGSSRIFPDHLFVFMISGREMNEWLRVLVSRYNGSCSFLVIVIEMPLRRFWRRWMILSTLMLFVINNCNQSADDLSNWRQRSGRRFMGGKMNEGEWLPCRYE